MTFQPVVPLGGIGGWTFLTRTLDAQQAAFRNAPALSRDADHFRERIATVRDAQTLVADRQLLRVALGAFGLDDDIDNRFFIRRVLEDGSANPAALANRLADKRYLALSEAFGFGDAGRARTGLPGFADRIVADFEARQFEVAVGTQDANLRLALGLSRDLGTIAASGQRDGTAWLRILGDAPLRQVFETAFALPQGFGALDLDRQVEVMRARTLRAFGDGSVAQFTEPDRLEALTRRFLLQADVRSGPGPTVAGSVAVQLLQAAARPAGPAGG